MEGGVVYVWGCVAGCAGWDGIGGVGMGSVRMGWDAMGWDGTE